MLKRRCTGIRGLGWALAVLHCAAAWPAVYYVDATGGNNLNNGTAPARAWRTLAKVNSTTFAAGDSILLKRGEEWRERLIVTASGTAALPILFDAYGTGPNPIINGANRVTAWTQTGPNLYTSAVTVAPEAVIFNGVKGERAASAAEVDSAGEWHWAANTLTIYSAGTPLNIEASARQFAVECFLNSYSIVRNLTIRYAEDPVRLLDTAFVTVENLTACDSAGYGGILLCSATSGRGSDNTVRNCLVYNVTGSAESTSGGGNGHGIFLWGQNLCGRNTISMNSIHDNGGSGVLVIDSSDNVVSGNTVWRQGSIGISLNGLNSNGNLIERNHVYENCRLENDRFGINLYMPGSDNVVRHNTVHDQHVFTDDEVGIPGFLERSGGIRYDGDVAIGVADKTGNHVYANVIYNEYEGIQVFNYSNVRVTGNTIHNVVRSGIHVGCANIPGAADGNRFLANIVAQAQQQLIWLNQATNTAFDYNAYYPDSPSAFNLNGVRGNLAGWRSATGADAHAVSGDPLFADAALQDFRILPGSPCIDTAELTGAGEADIAGVIRPQGGACDMGAYEFGQAPTAAFSAMPTSGAMPLQVQFSDLSTPGTSPITRWSWDFNNDGVEDSSEQNPVHLYALDGKYSVSLTVSNSVGNATNTQTDLINVTSGPSADFSAAPTSGIAPLAVAFTDASTGGGSPLVAWSWDFDGDGIEDSAAQHPLRTFAPGTYTIALTVRTLDGRSDTRVRAEYITAEVAPLADFTADTTSGFTPLTCQFTDASSPGSRPITAWDWDFGDASPHSALQHPAHTYTAAGSFRVTLTITTAAGVDTEARDNFIVTQPGLGPTAQFSADVTSGDNPLTVHFSDASAAGTAPITLWHWDFGDGQSSAEQHPVHVYDAAGTYPVSLSVTTIAGSDSEVKSGLIHVMPTLAPTAAFSIAPRAGQAPLTAHFTDESDPGSQPITAWHWDFGDGSSSAEQHPTHVYAQPGVFAVSLAVTTSIASDTATAPEPVRVFSVVFVDRDNVSGTEDGASWATAFTRIQDGLDMAASAGVPEVWVAEGRYDESRPDTNGALVLRENVQCYGGFTGAESDRDSRNAAAHAPIIDGAGARNGSAAYHVVTGANNALLDGFVITGGNADNTNLSRDRGAGMYNAGVSPAVVHCTFESNTAQFAGGGLFNTGGAAPRIESCVFLNNAAQASFVTQGYGGAIYNDDASSPSVTNCVFFGNLARAGLLADGYGGAIYNRNASPAIMNCSFSGNRTYGAFFTSGAGGAIYNYGGAPSITNCILWGDTPNEIRNGNGGSPVVNYCDVQGGATSGTGNLNVNPQFTDGGAGNLVPLPASPCINAGQAAGAPALDIAGMGRPQGPGVDMGAYEYGILPQAAFSVSASWGVAPFSLSLTDLSTAGTSPITAWSWDFGDGQSGGEQHPVHVYASPGTYVVRLAVASLAGESSAVPASVTVVAPLALSLQPPDHVAYAGEPLSLAVEATGGYGARYFQWWFGNLLIDPAKVGENGNTLEFAALSPSDAGRYWCEVSDQSGACMSRQVEVSVFEHLRIVEQPTGAEKTPGDPFAFHVGVTGGIPPISYLWKKDGLSLPAAGGDTLAFDELSTADAGTYAVEVADNAADSLESAPAELTVRQTVPALQAAGLAALAAVLALAGGLRLGRTSR